MGDKANIRHQNVYYLYHIVYMLQGETKCSLKGVHFALNAVRHESKKCIQNISYISDLSYDKMRTSPKNENKRQE